MPDERVQSFERLYANWLEVTFSVDDFVLDFGQRFSEQPPVPHCGIVATPTSVSAFVDVLTRSIAEYSRRYGGPPASGPE